MVFSLSPYKVKTFLNDTHKLFLTKVFSGLHLTFICSLQFSVKMSQTLSKLPLVLQSTLVPLSPSSFPAVFRSPLSTVGIFLIQYIYRIFQVFKNFFFFFSSFFAVIITFTIIIIINIIIIIIIIIITILIINITTIIICSCSLSHRKKESVFPFWDKIGNQTQFLGNQWVFSPSLGIFWIS